MHFESCCEGERLSLFLLFFVLLSSGRYCIILCFCQTQCLMNSFFRTHCNFVGHTCSQVSCKVRRCINKVDVCLLLPCHAWNTHPNHNPVLSEVKGVSFPWNFLRIFFCFLIDFFFLFLLKNVCCATRSAFFLNCNFEISFFTKLSLFFLFRFINHKLNRTGREKTTTKVK